MTKVSICIPAYHNVQGVERLLQSIAAQTYENMEVVITDDSTDERIGKLASGFEKVRYHHNPVRMGATANWNNAVMRSSGDYVKIMHHDDWLTTPDSILEFAALLDEYPEAVLAFSGSRQAESGKSFDRHIGEEDKALIGADFRNLFLGNTIGAPSAVMYRRCGIRFDETLTWLVDMEFYMALLQTGSFVSTEKPLVTIGIGSDQLTELCRDDWELNTREYGHIYNKYELWKKRACREKLMRIFADAGKPYSEIEPYQIEKNDYSRVKRTKLGEKIKWKLGIRE